MKKKQLLASLSFLVIGLFFILQSILIGGPTIDTVTGGIDPWFPIYFGVGGGLLIMAWLTYRSR